MFSFLTKNKAKATATGIPIAEVRHLSSLGMSEKDIIRRLKEQGYNYNDIEKAMMQAVKGGVEPQEPSYEELPQQPVTMDMGGEETQAYAEPEMGVSEEVPTMGELEGYNEPMQSPGLEPEGIAPDVAIEELVEGVVEEKWDDFSKRMERADSIVAELKTEIRILQNKIERLAQRPEQPEEMEEKFGQQLENLEVRISSLERAFKQMLPSLTRNIQELTFLAKQKNEQKETAP